MTQLKAGPQEPQVPAVEHALMHSTDIQIKAPVVIFGMKNE